MGGKDGDDAMPPSMGSALPLARSSRHWKPRPSWTGSPPPGPQQSPELQSPELQSLQQVAQRLVLQGLPGKEPLPFS